jgi:hypothetical protein
VYGCGTYWALSLTLFAGIAVGHVDQ